MKRFLLTLLFISSTASAYVPSPSSPNGTDRIRASDGSMCEQAVSTGNMVHAGVYGSDDNYDDRDYHRGYQRNDKGIYAGFQMQLGSKERVDCTRMYEYEMRERDRNDRLADAEYELRMMQIEAEKARLTQRGSTHFSE